MGPCESARLTDLSEQRRSMEKERAQRRGLSHREVQGQSSQNTLRSYMLKGPR